MCGEVSMSVCCECVLGVDGCVFCIITVLMCFQFQFRKTVERNRVTRRSVLVAVVM